VDNLRCVTGPRTRAVLEQLVWPTPIGTGLTGC
jgi:hypothetical protein